MRTFSGAFIKPIRGPFGTSIGPSRRVAPKSVNLEISFSMSETFIPKCSIPKCAVGSPSPNFSSVLGPDTLMVMPSSVLHCINLSPSQ